MKRKTVTRFDDGPPHRLHRLQMEWERGTYPAIRFDLLLTDGLAELSLDCDSQRLAVRLDASERAALREFLEEAERDDQSVQPGLNVPVHGAPPGPDAEGYRR